MLTTERARVGYYVYLVTLPCPLCKVYATGTQPATSLAGFEPLLFLKRLVFVPLPTVLLLLGNRYHPYGMLASVDTAEG
jgi:hypothetical protein